MAGEKSSGLLARRWSARRPRRRAGDIAVRAAIVIAAAFFAIPMYLLLVTALKTPSEIAGNPFGIPGSPQWANFSSVWAQTAGSGTASFPQSSLNSLLITGISTFLLVFMGASAGYVLGRRTSKFSNAAFTAFLIGISIPIQLVVIPLYAALDRLGLVGTLFGAVLLYVGLLTPFSVFLFTGFVRVLPRDFEEAAAMDGAGWMTIFFRVVLPLLKPIISTVAVLNAIAVWNDFFGQLILLNGSGNETLPVTVFSFAGQYASRYDLLSAGLVLAVIPILAFYLALQRRVISGFSSGLKG